MKTQNLDLIENVGEVTILVRDLRDLGGRRQIGDKINFAVNGLGLDGTVFGVKDDTITILSRTKNYRGIMEIQSSPDNIGCIVYGPFNLKYWVYDKFLKQNQNESTNL